MDTLLLIEDEKLFGTELARHYREAGWDVELVTCLAEARRALLEKQIDPLLVVSDMSLPDGNALDLMEQMRGKIAHAEWLFLTGYASVPDSVRALRLGAYDFLEKPCDFDRLDLVVASAARNAGVQRRVIEQARQQHHRYTPEAYLGHSDKAREIRLLLAKMSRVPFSVLVIGGETGTGKGLAARILHYGGQRARCPLVELNCAALPRDILESELFGHEAGAFTGATSRHRGLLEQADGGTLFLDEIGEMPPDLQAKLLKVIEDRRFRRLGSEKEIRVDVQIIAASHRDLEKMSRAGEFRADLYHRLSVFHLPLPPLREVREDLEELVPLFVAEFNAKAGKQVKTIPAGVWEQLKSYSWPGNVRELRNVIERCVLLSDGTVFPAQWLQLPAGGAATTGCPAGRDELLIPLDGSMPLEDMDRHIIRTVLERTGHNLAAAARALGTTRETLRYRVRKHGLSVTDKDRRD